MAILNNVKIIEEKPIPNQPIIINGLPDVGLVGVIAASEMISSLKMEGVARVESELLPPVVVLHKGLPYAPLRFFNYNNLLALVAEIAIPSSAVLPLSNSIVDWANLKKAKLLISLGGIAEPNRQNIEKPKVFGSASNQEALKTLENQGIEIMGEGYLVGINALIMKKCAELKINSICLLAQSFYNYPDPEAAAAVLVELNKLLNLKIDVAQLIEKGEKIRLKARDVMKNTQIEMERMSKAQEYDASPLYV